MKAVYEKNENMIELKVTVDGEQWEKALKKANAKAVSSLEIKGFRKGKVPASLAAAYINADAVRMDAAEKLAQEAFEFGLDENKDIKFVGKATFDFDVLTDELAVLKYTMEAYPEVTLGDYQSVEYKLEPVEVTEDEVNEQIEQLRSRNAEEVLKEEGTVEDGDIAVIDFEGFMDGVAFEGGKGTEYPLEIGSGSFIPGFEEQIIGMVTDEEKDINVTFPEDYAADLAGKDATFKVKVCGIKVKELPELTDEFVVESGYDDDVTTVEQLKSAIMEKLTKDKSDKAEADATDNLLTGICEVCPVTIPEVMIDDEVEDTYNNYEARLAQQGISMDMYFQITGTDEQMLRDNIRPQAEEKVRVRLVLEAIGKDLGIEATEEELAEEYEAMAQQYQMDVEEVKRYVPVEYLTDDVTMRKTLDSLKVTK